MTEVKCENCRNRCESKCCFCKDKFYYEPTDEVLIVDLQFQLTEKDKQITELKEKLYSNSRNTFAELNQETALSNERLMNEVADLEAQNEELQQKYLSESYEKAKLVTQVEDLEAQIEKMKCCGNCKYFGNLSHDCTCAELCKDYEFKEIEE